MFEKKSSTNMQTGIGMSKNADSYSAAKEATSQALNGLKGKKPTITYVFWSGDYDPTQLVKAFTEVLDSTEYIAGSTDAVYYNEETLLKGIVAVSIQSDFLHVGVASNDNVSKDPYKIAKKTIEEALSKLPIDKYVDPYMLFTRMKDSKVDWMVKLPSFFVTIWTRGMKLPVMGDETKIMNGIFDVVGSNVPLFGSSFGTSLDKLFGGKPYEIYAIHNGKILKDGLVVVFNTTSLVYGQSLNHGCVMTKNIGYISKTSANGYVVNEISNKNVVDWYCEKLGITKEEFIKNSMTTTQRWPLGIPDEYGNYIIRGAGVHQNGALGYVAPLIEGWPVYIMDASPKNLMSASKKVAQEIKDYTSLQKEKPAFILATLCASRRAIFQDKIKDELKGLRKEFSGAPLIGYSCFGEVGSNPGKPPKFNHMCANVFVMYDKLLTTLK